MTDKNIPNVKATAPKPSEKAVADSKVADKITEAQKPEQAVEVPQEAKEASKVADALVEAERPEPTVQPDVQTKHETAALIANEQAVVERVEARDTAKAGHNPLTIPFPSDPQGCTSALKRGGLEGAKRINGNPDRLRAYKRVLRLLAQHADARFEQDTGARDRARENAVAAAARVANKTKRVLTTEADNAEAIARIKRERAERA